MSDHAAIGLLLLLSIANSGATLWVHLRGMDLRRRVDVLTRLVSRGMP
jgi:hypothetical protein